MDDQGQVITFLGENFPYVLAFIAVLAAMYWFVLPFYKSFLSSKENSIKAMKAKLEECDKKINDLTEHIRKLEDAHRAEIELERHKSAVLMSFKDQAVGVFSVISKQFDIPLPKIIQDEINNSDHG